jgi:hypothetical protein
MWANSSKALIRPLLEPRKGGATENLEIDHVERHSARGKRADVAQERDQQRERHTECRRT